MQDSTAVGSRWGGSQYLWVMSPSKKNSPGESVTVLSDCPWVMHLWGCTSSSRFIRGGVPGSISRLLQQWLQVSTARPVTTDARTTHICDPSAITLGSCDSGLWDSNPLPFHLFIDISGQHGAILPSAEHATFLHPTLLFPPFTCNECNYFLLQFILMLVKWLKSD